MTLQSVLVVDDDPLVRRVLRENLQNDGFLVFEASAGKRLSDILKQQKVDAVLLDLHLPDGNGLDFLQDIRTHTDVPVIIVSGAGTKLDKLRGFRCGADDYVQKPFDIDELIARLHANMRRYSGADKSFELQDAGSQKIIFGSLVLDRALFQVFDKNNVSANLTAREFCLLEKLAANISKVVTREDLCEALRDKNYLPTPRAIDIKITRIRKKIGDNALEPHIIKTVRGVGYLLEN